MEAGMAKLAATEAAVENSLEAMRIHGGYGYSKEFSIERLYRDAPLLVIGEGTNETAAHHHRQAVDRKEPRMSLPLSGIRIIAVEQYGAGPFGTLHLADLGAEVIKIENFRRGRRHGARGRTAFFAPGDSHFHEAFNRNKSSLDARPQACRRARRCFASSWKAAMPCSTICAATCPAKLGVTYAQLANVQPAHRLRSPLGLRPQRQPRRPGRATTI